LDVAVPLRRSGLLRVRRSEPGPQPAPGVGDQRDSARPFRHATGLDWSGARPTRAFFRLLERAVADIPEGTVVVAAGAQLPTWAAFFELAWPDLRVVLVGEEDDESEAHARLSIAGPVDLVLQAADSSALAQARMFQRIFPHLREEGSYLTPRLLPWTATDAQAAREEDARARTAVSGRALPNEDSRLAGPFVGDLWAMVAEAQAARLRDFDPPADAGERFEDVRGLGRRLERVQVFSKMLRLRAQGLDLAKLTESEADVVLAARPEVGRAVTALPPTSLTARGHYLHNLPADPYFVPRMDVPKLTLREYDEPVCSRGQIVTSHNLLLPDTYRHHLAPRLVNIYVEEAAPRFGRVRRDLSSPEPLPGAWFNLDSEWPGHFGHLLTELLGRMWAWDQARRDRPDLKCLMTLQHDRFPAELRPFELDILDAFGIAAEDVHVFEAPCRPETLFSATSMFCLPDYVHPDMVQTWDRVGNHLASRADQRDRPRRIFCTRPVALKRSCHNTAQVEELFVRHGFEVIRPEEHTVAEQVALFRNAEAVGGFAGSGLFTLALCDTAKQVFTVAPTSYTARNEHLIAAARGHDIVSAWSTPDQAHPEGVWSSEAFSSGFTFDLADEGAFLADHLARLGPA
jgi:capsular polysaccharide biosynthesis protein